MKKSRVVVLTFLALLLGAAVAVVVMLCIGNGKKDTPCVAYSICLDGSEDRQVNTGIEVYVDDNRVFYVNPFDGNGVGTSSLDVLCSQLRVAMDNDKSHSHIIILRADRNVTVQHMVELMSVVETLNKERAALDKSKYRVCVAAFCDSGESSEVGNNTSNNPKPAPEVKETPAKTSQNNNTPTTNTATSPTGPKANVPEQPKPSKSVMFGNDKVGTGQASSTAERITSGTGAGNGYGNGAGYGNAWGNGGGSNGGVGSGKWKKIPDFSDLSCDKDFYIEFKCTVDDKGSVSNAVKVNDSGAPASLVSEVKRKILSEAKYSAGSPGEITIGITLKKN